MKRAEQSCSTLMNNNEAYHFWDNTTHMFWLLLCVASLQPGCKSSEGFVYMFLCMCVSWLPAWENYAIHQAATMSLLTSHAFCARLIRLIVKWANLKWQLSLKLRATQGQRTKMPCYHATEITVYHQVNCEETRGEGEKKEEKLNMCDCHMRLVWVCRWRTALLPTDVKFNSFKGAKWTLTSGPGVFQIKSYK